MEINIQELLQSYNKTKQEFIDMVKVKGELIEHVDHVIPLLNDKYGERALLQYDELFHVTYTILANFADIVYKDDIIAYDLESEAREYYFGLPNILNDEENE